MNRVSSEKDRHSGSGQTLALTFGAMIVAIFGVMLLINRQTGGFLEEIMVFLYPIPMVAYGARYGLKKSLPVFFCTMLIAILFGTFSGFFYAVSYSLVGMILGDCLYRKRDAGKTLFLVIILAVTANLLSSVILASLFGINLTAEMNEMRDAMLNAAETAISSQGGSEVSGTGLTSGGSGLTEGTAGASGGQSLVDALSATLTPQYILRVYIIANVILGVVQGIVIYELSLIILRRLKFKVQRPKPLSQFAVPKWTGILALSLFLLYYGYAMMPFGGDIVNGIVQTVGLCGYMYLVCFGVYGAARFLKHRAHIAKVPAVLLALLGTLFIPYLIAIVGFDYISLHLKKRIEA